MRELVTTNRSKVWSLYHRFGADLKRLFRIMEKKISCQIILANLDRFIQFVWIKVFYRAKNFNNHCILFKFL
jgi:hypothetical protein